MLGTCLVNIEACELFVQTFAGDVEGLGGLAFVVVIGAQRFDEDVAFELGHSRAEVGAGVIAGMFQSLFYLADARGQVVGQDEIVFRSTDENALYFVL